MCIRKGTIRGQQETFAVPEADSAETSGASSAEDAEMPVSHHTDIHRGLIEGETKEAVQMTITSIRKTLRLRHLSPPTSEIASPARS